LLQRFGSLARALEAQAGELAAIDGLGPKNILGLKLVPAVAGRYLQDLAASAPGGGDTANILQYLRFTLAGLQHEVFKIILIDAARALCGEENISRGTIDKTVVFVREIIDTALRKKAAAILCAHNHPSGGLAPSKNDLLLTRKIYYACRLVEIELIDHIIVTREGIYSFAREGGIKALEGEYLAAKL
jgi:DNA repair protein RadC